MFASLQHLSDLQPFVAHKREIKFSQHANGVTLGCYQFMDSHTFDTPLALECRGIAFDAEGRVCSRPLHKFFNVGEKEHLQLEQLSKRQDIVAVFEKLDGSMLATAWVNGALQWRSKKSFNSDVVGLTKAFLSQPENQPLEAFARKVAQNGMTAIFELTHPLARIVVACERPQLRLLHVRDNESGAYVLLDPSHPVHGWVAEHGVELVPRFNGMTLEQAVQSLETMREHEGYVLQFADGDMVKLKCPWYLHLHRSITFLRERDIAVAALADTLDDVKSALSIAGVDLAPVNEVESRLMTMLLELQTEVETQTAATQHLARKEFAQANQKHPLFGLMMARYLGREPDYKDWFTRNRLREAFSLRVLADGALAEALEG